MTVTFSTSNSGLCQKCHEHPASTPWVGEDGTLAFAHGMVAFWCKCCTIGAQLDHARKMAERIPGLEEELTTACRGQP